MDTCSRVVIEYSVGHEDRVINHLAIYRFYFRLNNRLDQVENVNRRVLCEILLLQLRLLDNVTSPWEKRWNKLLYRTILGLPRDGENKLIISRLI